MRRRWRRSSCILHVAALGGLAVLTGRLGQKASQAWAAALTTGTIARELKWPQCRRAHQRPTPPLSLRCLGQEGVAESLPETSANETPFSLDTAVLLAGFAFETYNTPDTVRWERGEDGLNVALLSDTFVPSVYNGVLNVRLRAVEDLREETGGASEALLTGSRSDPYVLLNVMEDGQSLLSKSAIATGSINERRMKQSLDVKRSSTIWRGGGPGRAEWEGEGNGEVIQLYLVDPMKAALGIRVMDENVAGEDQLLGASELDLRFLVMQEKGSWNGSIPLVYKEKDWDWGAGVAGLAASAFTGLATGGASLAVGAAAMLFKAVSPADQAGVLHVELGYQALEATLDNDAAASDIPGQAPVGATPGVDWSEMCEGVGGIALTASSYDFLGFVSNEHTSTEAGIWRDTARKRIVLAFRGTEMTDVKDVMVDANIEKTAWARREKGEPEAKDTEPLVHAGFRAALDSVAQRLKALLNQAVGGSPEEWHVFVTGHSLGGALATLMAMDLAGGLDAAKGLPVAPKQPPWFRAMFFGEKAKQHTSELPKFRRLSLYTFGAPRVGNVAFADALNAAVPEAFRIVNSQDIVTRAPRGFFQHGGRTALLFNASTEWVPGTDAAKRADTAIGLWVEGESKGQCPLRDDSVLRSPLDEKSLLGKLKSTYDETPLSAVFAATAERVGKATDELQNRLGSATGATQAEFQQMADTAKASIAELQAANERANKLGQQLVAARKNGAAAAELSALEAEAAKAVASDLQRALEGAEKLGALGARQLSTAGTDGSSAAQSGLREAIAALGDAQAAAAASAGHMAQGIGRIQSDLGQKIASASFGDFVSIIGIDAAYADNEVQLLKAIGTGQAITQHLEPSYHAAMWSAVREHGKTDKSRAV